MAVVAFDARDAFAAPLRGWGRYARELLRAMSAALNGDGGLELRTVDGGGRGPELVFEQLTLPRALRAGGAAAVHVPNCFLPLRRPCPGVVTVHDVAFEDHPDDFSRRTGWKYRTLAPRAARSAERVICVSEFTRTQVCERWGVDPSRTRVIGEAPALPTGDEPPPRGPYLLAVGDLRRKKNLVRLVEAFRLLRRDGLPHRLVLAGLDAGEGERIREAAASEPVELPGYVTDPQLDALMRGADALVHPSLHEGFGLVPLEAMARACPVASARAGALPETCGDAAVYFDPHDPADIADAIRRTLDERPTHAARAHRHAATYSWDAAARATIDVYRELLA